MTLRCAALCVLCTSAQVYAHMKLGEAEPGFENAPGMLYLAGELYRAATNASLGLGDAAGRSKQLLSFQIEPAGEAGQLASVQGVCRGLNHLQVTVWWPPASSL